MAGQVKWSKTFILALILTAVSSLAYYLEYKKRPKDEEKTEAAKKLFVLKGQSVSEIKIDSGSKSVSFHCLDLAADLCKPGDSAHWELTSPTKIKADDQSVSSLLSSLNQLEASDTIDLSAETPEKRALLLKDYRLDGESRQSKKETRVELTFKKGDKAALYLGDLHPVGEAIFASSGDENKVYLVPTYIRQSLEKDLGFWRDKKLLTLSSHLIEKFSFEGPKVRITAEKDQGRWKIKDLSNKGEEFSGDNEGIDGFLSAVSYLNAKEFPSENKKDARATRALSGTQRLFTLTLEPEKSEPIVLKFFEKKAKGAEKIYATVSNLDPLFDLELSVRERLNKELKDFRLSKLLTSMDRFTAQKLSLAMGGKTLAIENTGTKWINSVTKSELDSEKIQNLLDRLSNSKIKTFIAKKDIPSGVESGLTFVMGDDKEPKKRYLVFWKKGTELLAKDLNSKKNEAFELEESLVSLLPWDLTLFDQAAKK